MSARTQPVYYISGAKNGQIQELDDTVRLLETKAGPTTEQWEAFRTHAVALPPPLTVYYVRLGNLMVYIGG
jgi:hypothetical protein